MNTVNYSQPDKSLFASGGLAELVDAYALGAYDFGHESSSLLSPTRKTSEVTILDETNLLHEMLHLLKDVAESLRKVKWVWFIRDWLVLGKNHPTHIHSLLHILLQHQRLFFKQSMYALVNSFCNKCNKTTSLLYFYCNKNHQCMYLTLRIRTL
jgi:hypothetical protein